MNEKTLITKISFILALLIFCLFAGPSCAAELSGNNKIGVDVGNDDGTYLVPGTAYQLNLEAEMADLHIASDPAESAGNIAKENTSSGTFYISCTNDSRVFDDTVLMLAVNGTIADNFSVAITSSGYRWDGSSENSNLPEFGNLTYVPSALSENFEKVDLSYGPQTWKPANSADSPIYNCQNMSDAEDTFSLVFIDLNAGVLCNALNNTGSLTDGGAVKIDYAFENLESFAVFNAYGLTNTSSAEIVTTNDVFANLYSVLIEPDAAEPVLDNITVAPSTATVEINGTANFTATAYDTEGSVMSGIIFNWSVSDEAVGNVTSEGVFTAVAAGTVNVTASHDDVSGISVVTVSAAEESEEPAPMLFSTSSVGLSSVSSDPGTYGGVIPAVNNVFLKVANDYGARFNDFGNDTFNVRWTGGGMNAVHIAQGGSGFGELTSTNSMTGTFHVTETGGRGYHDEIFLCVAVNGTIPDDFRIHITAEGYQWTPNATPHTEPVIQEIEYVNPTIDEWFDKDDFIYGPQIWRPAAGTQYPIFSYSYDEPTNVVVGQDMTDTSNTFMMMFVDLNGGILSGRPLKVQYEIENLNTMAAFDVYAYTKADTVGSSYAYNVTSWTNALLLDGNGPNGWTVSGAPLPDAASVVIAPVSASVPVNGKQQFTTMAYDSNGDVINGAPITWSSSNTGVGTIDADGLFTPVSEGSTIVTATSGDASQTAAVTVVPVVEKVLTSITLDPDGVIMYTDQIENNTFTATGYDQFGDEISAVYTWSSTVPVVGSIDQTGFFTGKTEGTTVISATSGSVTQTATVEIKQHPDWEVSLIGGFNRTLSRADMIDLASSGTMSYTDVRDIYWEGVNLTSVIGLFDDHDPSTFNTTLASFDYNITLKGEASGTEKTVLITTFELLDNDDGFMLGYLMDGYEVPEYPVDGRTYWPLKFTGSSIASYGRNLEEITNITLELPPDVQRIGLTHDTLKAYAGGKAIQFAAAAYDSNDIEIDYIPFTWSVSDSSIGTIDSDGLFTPLNAGKLNVTATYKSVSGSVEIEVMDNLPSAKTWYVDQSGNGDFTNIQAAIDYGARDGDTIIVRDGVYEEKVTIDKGVTLISENGPNSTVIQNLATNLLDNMVTVTADDVTISGFNFSFVHNLKQYAALTISSAKNTEVTGNIFSDGYYAIRGSGGENAIIANNYFTSDGGSFTRTFYMLYLGSPKNYLIRNNTMDNFYNGIDLTGTASGNRIENNSLFGGFNEGASSSSYGVHLEDSSGSDTIIVNNNYISYCTQPLHLTSVTDITVFGNYIDSGGNVGLYTKDCKNINVVDNFFGEVTSYGLYIGKSASIGNLTVVGNIFGAGGWATLEFEAIDDYDSVNVYMNDIYTSDSPKYGKIDFYKAPLISLNSTSPVTYVYNGETYTEFVGNWYDSYDGADTNGDGLSESPYYLYTNHYSPLVSKITDYLILEAAGINVTPSTATLEVGESTDFTASAIDQRGIDFPQAAFEFSSSDPAIGTIDPATGHFEALSPGNVTVTATSGNAAGTAEVTIVKMTKKEETTNFEVTNCTINGNGDGGNSVKVKVSDAAVVNNSIRMQGNGFNLTIQTAAAPVVNGDDIEGDIENIVLDTTPVKADLQSAGNVSASVSLDLTGLPAGAGITTTIAQNVDDDSQSAFQLAASKDGLNLNAVAYTMNIVKTNLANGADIKDATISMAVSHDWVVANGGVGSVKIIRFAEDGKKEVLTTVYVGTEGDMDKFEAYSPNGLSIFGLAATSTPAAAGGATTGSTSSSGGGKTSVVAESVENIATGETVSLVFDESAVSSINLKAAAEIPQLLLTVEEVTKPSGIGDAPDQVYQYVDINSYHAPEGSIQMATIHFSVPKEWIKSVSSTAADVNVYHYDEEEEEWNLLSTVSEGSDVYAYNFFADTDGFSLFAITAKENTATPNEAASAVSTDSGEQSGVSQTSGTGTSTEETGKPIPMSYLLLATGLIIVIPAAGYGWLKIKKNK